jgi:hypothetical protein
VGSLYHESLPSAFTSAHKRLSVCDVWEGSPARTCFLDTMIERRHLGYASSSNWKMFINYNHGVSVNQSKRHIAEWRQIHVRYSQEKQVHIVDDM